VIVTVVTMWVMEMSIDQIIDVIAMGNRQMATIWTVPVI
tara:strand:- start:785 stop:901 length:117 start_codon:yes stop_codon:yes gene_type:complete